MSRGWYQLPGRHLAADAQLAGGSSSYLNSFLRFALLGSNPELLFQNRRLLTIHPAIVRSVLKVNTLHLMQAVSAAFVPLADISERRHKQAAESVQSANLQQPIQYTAIHIAAHARMGRRVP